MPDAPPIRQEIIVNTTTTGDKNIADTQKSLKELGKAWDEQNESFEDFTKRMAEFRIRSREVNTAIREQEKALRAQRTEVDKNVQSHGLLSRALHRNRDDHQQLTRDVHKLAKGFDLAGSAAGLFATFIGFVKFPAIVAGANLATSAIGALGSAVLGLVAALGPMLNLVGLIPAALAGAAGGLGAVLLGSRGVTEAIGAGFAAKKPGAGGAPKDQVAEARKLEDAVRGVARAQETLSDSQREVQRAQEDLNKAWLDARNNLRDLREEQTRGSNSVARAEIALVRAQERNAEIQSDEAATAIDKKEALLDVSDAQLDLLDAQQKRTQNARDLADAEAKGVEGSDAVVDATERVSDAQQSVTDNTLELKRAIEDVGRAMKDSGGAGSPADKFADSLKELGPEAREFVNAIVGNADVFKSFKRDVGESLFAPINDGIKGVIANAPAFKSFLTDSASGVGEIGKAVAKFFGSEGFAADLRTLGRGNEGIFKSLADGAKSLLQVFTDLAVVGQPFVKEIVDLAVNGLGKFADKIKSLRENGGLERAFQNGLDVAKQFGEILRNTIGIIGDVLRAAKPLGDDLFKSLGDILQRTRDFTQSFEGQNQMRKFFDDMRPVLSETADLLGDIGGLFINLAQKNAQPLADVLKRLRTEVLPIVKTLLDSVGPAFMDGLLDVITSFAQVASQIFGESGPMLIFFGTLKNVFTLINTILETFPQLKDVILLLITAGTIWKTLKLSASLLGITGVIDAFKSLTGVINAASGVEGAGGVAGFIQMVGGLGPAGIIVGTLAITVGGLFFAWREATRGAREYKKTLESFKGAFKDALADPTVGLRTTLGEAVAKRVGDRHQQDDLERAGIRVDEITNAVIAGGTALEDLRRKAVDAGEVTFGSIGPFNKQKIEEAADVWVATGETVKGVFVNDLGQTFADYSKAAQEAAKQAIAIGVANGQITPEVQKAAAQFDLQNQGIQNYITNGPNYVAQAGFIDQKNADIADELERQNRATQLAHDLARDPHGVRDAERRRNDAEKAAFEKGKAAEEADKKAADLAAKGLADTEEGKQATEDATEAHEDFTAAVEDAGDAQVALADAQAKRRGEDLSDAQVFDARQSVYEAFGAFVAPGSKLRTDLDSLKQDLAEVEGEHIMDVIVNVQGKDDNANAWMSLVLGKPIKAVPVPVLRQNALTTQFSQGTPPTAGGFKSPAAASAGKAGGTDRYHYAGYSGYDRNHPPPPEVHDGKEVKPQWDGNAWYFYYAGGGKLPPPITAVGPGFKTRGITAIAGEGKPQFPEYVIPSDPQHRSNAWLLMMDLLGHIGNNVPKMQGGGVLDLGQFRAFAGSVATAGDHVVTTTTSIAGDTIGTSIGNSYSIGELVVSDWDAAKQQMERDLRLRNMTVARGARSAR